MLDSLTPAERDLAQAIMLRIQTILNSDRSRLLDMLQHLERRADKRAEQINDLQMRLDNYVQKTDRMVLQWIEHAAQNLPSREEFETFLQVLYSVAARTESLEAERRNAQ